MEITITILATAFVCLACFMAGAKVGQAVVRGKEIEMPSVNPIEAMRERNAKKEAEYNQERIDTIMRNIESYDGTSNGQEDVPR